MVAIAEAISCMTATEYSQRMERERIESEYEKNRDPWAIEERDNLRQDVEELEIEVDGLTTKVLHLKLELADTQRMHAKLKNEFEERIADANGELKDKAMIYLNLINEYEKILSMYAGHNGVELTTNELRHLRKQGGFII